MNKSPDIRWEQRFANYQKALARLRKYAAVDNLNELEEQGLIQCFEYTHELAWNTLKDFLVHRGNRDIYGSKDATREAFSVGLIDKGDVWMMMIQDRNKTSHTYNTDTAKAIVDNIKNHYVTLFEALAIKLQSHQHDK